MNAIRIGCVLALVCSTAIARAQVGIATTEDVIALRDGTIYRGRVTRMKPGELVEIVLLDGRSQLIAWSDIASSAGPSFPEDRKALVDRWLQPAPGREPVEVQSEGQALVIGVMQTRPLIGQESATLSDGYDVAQLTTDWQSRRGIVVCTSTPCRIYAPAGELLLQSSGPGVLSSTEQVVVQPGGVRVTLRAPTVAGRRRGGALIALSLAGVIAGPVMLGLGGAFSGDKSTDGASTPCYAVGGVLLTGGVVALIAGIAILASNKPGVASVEPLTGTVRF